MHAQWEILEIRYPFGAAKGKLLYAFIAWREFSRYFEHLKQVFQEFWDELWVIITNDIIWKTVMLRYFFHIHVYIFSTIDNLHAWKEMWHVSELIYNSKNNTKTLWRLPHTHIDNNTEIWPHHLRTWLTRNSKGTQKTLKYGPTNTSRVEV
mgnify:FL=1